MPRVFVRLGNQLAKLVAADLESSQVAEPLVFQIASLEKEVAERIGARSLSAISQESPLDLDHQQREGL